MKTIAKVSGALLAGAAMLTLAQHAAGVPGWPGLQIVRPAQAASVAIGIFFDRLAPYGTWVHHPRYDYVFVPAVGPGWRPYVHGNWVYTDEYGWYWESDEPFAWAVYHYGRWFYDPVYGWCWVPGNVWAPAWVTWRYGGGSVGWAAIGPHEAGYVYGTPDYYEPYVVEAWVFVPERRFVTVNLHRYVVPVVEINIFLGKAREKHHVHYRDGRARNPFLSRDRVRQITKSEVSIYKVQEVDAPEEAMKARSKDKGRTIRAFQAEIAEAKPDEKPRKIATRPEEVKSRPRLKETATKGERPQDAPPSAAELSKERATPDRVEDGGKPDGKSGAPAEAKGDADEKPTAPTTAQPEDKSEQPPTAARPEDKSEKPSKPDSKQADEPKATGKPKPPEAKLPDKPDSKQAKPKAPDEAKPPQAEAPAAPKPHAEPKAPAAAPQAGPPQGKGGPGPGAGGPPQRGGGSGPRVEGPSQGGGAPEIQGSGGGGGPGSGGGGGPPQAGGGGGPGGGGPSQGGGGGGPGGGGGGGSDKKN